MSGRDVGSAPPTAGGAPAVDASATRRRCGPTIYTPELSARGTGPCLHAALSAAVRGDPAGGRLLVAYRPVVDLDSGAPAAYEAELEWVHPRFGTMSARQLLPDTHALGLAPVLDRVLLRRACAEATADIPGPGTLPVHVTLTATRTDQASLFEDVTSALAAADLPPARLVLQVRPPLAPDLQFSVGVLTNLHDIGVRIGLAPVGAADAPVDAAVGTLRAIPVDVVTLDPALTAAWVSADDRSHGSRAVDSAGDVDALLDVVRSRGITVVAGGADTAETAARLRDRGCRYITAAPFIQASRPDPAE